MENLINGVISKVNDIGRDVKDLPSVHDIGALIPPRVNLDDISDKLDHVAQNIDMLKSKSGGRTDTYNCKGEDDRLSNLFPCKVHYNNDDHDSAEHAIQITRALHVYGGVNPSSTKIIEEIKETVSPKQVKILADQKIPDSPSWMRKERRVIEEVITAKFDQNPEIDQFLKDTGNMKIRHTVASNYWGTGRYGKGKNILGKLLEARRDGKPLASVSDESNAEEAEDSSSDAESSQISDGWATAGRPIKFKASTENVIIGDSLTDGINPDVFAKGTEIVKAATIADFESTVARMIPNDNIKNAFAHVAINDVVDRQENTMNDDSDDISDKANRLTDALKGLKEKLPNAKIFYSEALDRDRCDEVGEFNYYVEVFKNNHENTFEYIPHSIDSSFFRDRKHLTDSGNRIFIKHLKDKIDSGRGRGYQRQGNPQGNSYHRRGDSRDRPYDRRSGSQDRPYNRRNTSQDRPYNRSGPQDRRGAPNRRGYKR